MKTGYTEGDARAVIAGFAAAFEGEAFRAELDRLAGEEWGWGTPEEIQIQPLKAHRRRCTFDVAVRTERGWHNVIGKIHNDDRSDAFEAMDAVRRAGFGPDAAFSIPRPLAYLPALHVLLEEKVPGPSAKEIFLIGEPPEHAVVAELAGEWLARFHDAAPRFGPVADIVHLVGRCRAWTERIVGFGEPLARKATALLRHVEDAVPAPRAGGNGHRAGHGSFMPEHVILSGERTTTIDLDEYDVADPARDLAWFIVSLQRLALKEEGSLHGRDAAVDRFVQAYAAAGRWEALSHLPFYRAVECLHRARRDLVKRIPPIREWAEIMLDEGLLHAADAAA